MAELKGNKKSALETLVAGGTVEMAAAGANVTSRTIYNWLNDDDFKSELQKRRDVLFDQALNSLTIGSVEAVTILRSIARKKDAKDSVRVAACRAIIDTVLRVKEAYELSARVAALEAALSGSTNNGKVITHG